MSGPVYTARQAWGDDLPDWVLGLAQACAATSQNKVAIEMSRSAAVISTVLRNKYSGDMVAIEDIYRGVFEDKVLTCPALGNLPTHECRKWRSRSRKLVTANAHSVMMFRACKRCPINEEGA